MWLVMHYNYDETYNAVCCYERKEDAIEMYDTLVRETIEASNVLDEINPIKLENFVQECKEKLDFDMFKLSEREFDRVRVVQAQDKQTFYV